MNTFIYSIFEEETFGVSLVLIPIQILLYNQIFLLSDGRSLALLYIKTPWSETLSFGHLMPLEKNPHIVPHLKALICG